MIIKILDSDGKLLAQSKAVEVTVTETETQRIEDITIYKDDNGHVRIVVGALGFGSIKVHSSPSQGEIFLDGQGTGEITPGELKHVVVGTYDVTVRFPGMVDATRSGVEVKAGETTEVILTLDDRQLSGRVLKSRGGAVVKGATVDALIAGADQVVSTTTTDDNGHYYFPELPSGLYDIRASKEGHATGLRQSVSVSERSASVVDLIARGLFDKSKSAHPPRVKVYGLEAGAMISDETDVVITVNGDYPVEEIQVRFGHDDLDPDDRVELRDRYELAIDPYVFPNGETSLNIVVYDVQGSRSELRVPFIIVGEPLAPILNTSLTAYTASDDLGLFAQESELQSKRLLRGERPGLTGLYQAMDRSGATLSSMRADTTIYIVFDWEGHPDAFAYDIQRSWDASGPWTTVSTTPWAAYTDVAASLEPGRQTFYRVRPVGPFGDKGPWSAPVSVTPLKRLEVNLVAPSDGQRGVSLSPTLTWEHNDVGENIYFEGFVHGVTDAYYGGVSEPYLWSFWGENFTEIKYNENGTAYDPLLTPAKEYEWDIEYAEAYKLYSYRSEAYSFGGGASAFGGTRSGSNNGSFTFTTTRSDVSEIGD